MVSNPVPDFHTLLDNFGPCLSSKLGAEYRKLGVSDSASRKRISRGRSSPDIGELRSFSFPRNARFLYPRDQYKSERYWEGLIDAIRQESPTYSAAISGIESKFGIIPKSQFDIISGSPVLQKKHVSSSNVLSRLLEIELVELIDIDGVGECVALNERAFGRQPFQYLHARLNVERVLLQAIISWATKLNFSSANATKSYSTEAVPKFGTFKFDICGPSYLLPVRGTVEDGEIKPGFFVADVYIGRSLDELHVLPFIRKCKTLLALKKLPKFFPMLIADGFSREALYTCRKLGIIATVPESLFGHSIAKGLEDLFNTLKNAAAVAASNPEKISEIFNSLSTIEGAAVHLRGALFELIAGHIVKEKHCGSVDIGIIVHDKKLLRELKLMYEV